MKNIIELKKIEKRYDQKFTLGPIDLEIPSGVIVGLIGENGAGKTTLIKAILNIVKTENSTIKIFGKELKVEEENIKEEIGVVLDQTFFPELLTPSDIDSIMKDIYKNWDKELYLKYIKEFDLPLHKPIRTLSKGMRKKLEIATALSHHPKLLLLDEPTSGLDPVAREELLDLFQEFIQEENHSILLSTHITSDLEQIADYIIFLDQGKVILEKTRDEIMDSYGILKCGKEEFKKIEKKEILRYKENKYDIEVLVNNKEKIGKKYKNLTIDKVTLEEFMVLMIKGEKIC